MTFLKTAKKLVPLPIRSLIKKSLLDQTGRQTVQSPRNSISCPLCGTTARPVERSGATACAGCGSTKAQRHLALAVYADIKANKGARVLALGSDPMLRLLCEDMDKVHFAEDPSEVVPELLHQFNLCIHSNWIEAYPSGPEIALKNVNGLLSPLGKQIFSTDLSAMRWRNVKHPMTSEALMKWLTKKGRYQAFTRR